MKRTSFKINQIVIVLSLLLTLFSCCLSDSSSIYWTSSNSDYQIVFEYNLFKDAEVLLSNGIESYHLFHFLPTDANEEIEKFGYSEDEDKFAFLIANSNQYSYGTNLLVFSAYGLITDLSISPLLEVNDIAVTDFTISNETINYFTVDSVEHTLDF